MRVSFFFNLPPILFFFAFPCDCKACILVHHRPSLSTTARARGYGDRSGWTLVASFTKWISGKRRSPLARHATMQTPQIEKKNKHYIQIRIIHIKNMKQVLHINACIQKKKYVWWRQGKLNVQGPWLRVILVLRLLVRGRLWFGTHRRSPLSKLRLVSQVKNEGACRCPKKLDCGLYVARQLPTLFW